MWKIVLLSLSAIMFFGFVALNVCKFGLLDCYSAYGVKWRKEPHQLNWWIIVTVLSALLIVPVLLDNSEGSLWQFTGFLAPISLVLVGNTPDYKENKVSFWLHQIGAWGAVVMILLYIIMIPKLIWIVTICIGVALILTWIFGWKYWTMFLEMGMYAAIYSVLFATIL